MFLSFSSPLLDLCQCVLLIDFAFRKHLLIQQDMELFFVLFWWRNHFFFSFICLFLCFQKKRFCCRLFPFMITCMKNSVRFLLFFRKLLLSFWAISLGIWEDAKQLNLVSSQVKRKCFFLFFLIVLLFTWILNFVVCSRRWILLLKCQK